MAEFIRMIAMCLKERGMNLIKMLLAASFFWAGTALADRRRATLRRLRCRLKAARANGKPIFLYFGRYGCAWCDHTNKKTFPTRR